MSAVIRLIHRLVAMSLIFFVYLLPGRAQDEYVLKPAIAMEAEDFTVENGWEVLKNGQGNYMVDIVGFQHISGERLLCVDEKNSTASAYKDITVPQAGDFRLWVRYEYPPFTDDRFQVIVQQEGQTVAQMMMGAKDNPRAAFGDYNMRPQYDPSWGSEGLAEEVLDVKRLQAGPARIYLKAVEQPQVPGVSAHRNIDLLYLTSDTADGWVQGYPANRLYPILDAFRDTVGARYEVQFTNLGAESATYTITHAYNRIPWSANEGVIATDVVPKASTEWIPIKLQDTSHFGCTYFGISSDYQPYQVVIRPIGNLIEQIYNSERVYTKSHNAIPVYLPPYPGKGEVIVTPIDEINAAMQVIKDAPPVGRKPTLPLCYGTSVPLWDDSVYGNKYADLYVAVGIRFFPQFLYGEAFKANDMFTIKQLEDRGIVMNKSLVTNEYRNPPTYAQINKWKKEFDLNGHGKYLKWFDYGDEMAFFEWISYATAELAATDPQYKDKSQQDITNALWQTWLMKNRPEYQAADYWLKAWGDLSADKLRPDSSAAAAAESPRLYIDSLTFYEDTAMRFAANGMKQVKATFGQDVLCGANYSGHPYYYPTTTMYVKWFRSGAADMGRHSDYFWEVGQPGPMVNGYFAEHFRCGMRYNSNAVVKQYNMPHSPGNTSASFLRSAFTHLAHGVKYIDFFGMGMNECFSENYIDHRDHQRYKDLRDVTYSMGLVEDMLPQSKVVPSDVAMLISDSTERWDFAKVALDNAAQNLFGGEFRNTRLSFHQERLGMWYALTFAGAAPDLLIEADINPTLLSNYKVLYIVGDCLPTNLTPTLESWIKQGGILMATAGVGLYDQYRKPNPALQKLLGIASRKLEERTTFFRPRMELPFLQPLSRVEVTGLEMPQLATFERITPSTDAKTVATFTDDSSPAVIVRSLGKGKVYYCAALLGVAYMWDALQPVVVPDRSPGSHTVPTNFNKGAASILNMPLKAAKLEPLIIANLDLIDARLLKASQGYILPMANYNTQVGQQVTFSIKLNDKVKSVNSSYCGPLPFTLKKGRLIVTLPSLGYGDLLRIETTRK